MDKNTLLNYMGFLNVVSGICTFLVAFGVAGEFLVHILHSRWDKQLDAIQEREKEELKQSAAAANERAAQLEHKTEELRKVNLDLETYISPRSFKAQHEAAKALSPFAGTKVAIEYLPDVECKRTAGLIAFALMMAKWQILSQASSTLDEHFSDGVDLMMPSRDFENRNQLVDAATALAAELNKTGIKTKPANYSERVEKGTIRVRVGMKPGPDSKEQWRVRDDFLKMIEQMKTGNRPPEKPADKKD